MKKPKLTIGMPHFQDFDGVWFTIQSLCLHHKEVMQDVEILVVDETPQTAEGQAVRGFIERAAGRKCHSMRYIKHDFPLGPALSKNDVFLHAKADNVLCMDCHILFPPGTIERLIEWFDTFAPKSEDLFCGPNLLDDLQTFQTEMTDVWRGENWGIWHNNEKGNSPENPPYEIWGNGCGVMACRKFAWLGFNPHMRGFGGEEGYIHEKFRKFGRKVINLPFLQWIHRYQRPGGPRYRLSREVKMRNLVIGFLELGRDLDPIYNHFVSLGHEGESLEEHLIREHSVDPESLKLPDGNKIDYDGMQALHKKFKTSEENWRYLIEDPINHYTPESLKVQDKGMAVANETMAELLKRVLTTERDLNKHLPKIIEVAEKCEVVEEITRRYESTVALLSTSPTKLHTFLYGLDATDRMMGNIIHVAPPSVDFKLDVGPEFNPEIEIGGCDLFFFKCPHNYHNLQADLMRWAPKVKRFIIIHDTEAHGVRWEDDGGVGLVEGMKALLRNNPEWFVYYHSFEQWGLTILGCQEQDKPQREMFAWEPGFGPGTELKKILDACGVPEKADCTCNATRLEMDILGVEGCRQERDRLVATITENAGKWEWAEKVRIAANLATGKEWKLAWKIDLNDPYGSLFDIAVQRAAESDEE
jgi:hypothetical protein